MNNMLRDELLTYLDTLDYSFLEKDDEYIVADKVSFGGVHETQQLWVPSFPERDEDIPHLEQRLLRQFEQGVSCGGILKVV